MRREVHLHSGDRRREVGPVIEVEAAQVVLVGLALPRMLADDDARDGLEDVSGPRDGPYLDLFRGHRALCRGVGDPDEALARLGDVSHVAEGPSTGHENVGRHRETQRRIRRGGRIRRHDDGLAHDSEKAQQAVDHPVGARWHIVESELSVESRRGDPRRRDLRALELDGDAGQRRAGLVGDLSLKRSRGRGAQSGRHEHPDDDSVEPHGKTTHKASSLLAEDPERRDERFEIAGSGGGRAARGIRAMETGACRGSVVGKNRRAGGQRLEDARDRKGAAFTEREGEVGQRAVAMTGAVLVGGRRGVTVPALSVRVRFSVPVPVGRRMTVPLVAKGPAGVVVVPIVEGEVDRREQRRRAQEERGGGQPRRTTVACHQACYGREASLDLLSA